jgi:6-pyruvoyltetrahydropterin/6-carboxytetrahydropterin synthase
MILSYSFRLPISHSHKGQLSEATHHHEAVEIEVRVEGELNREGFVVDYREIERLGEREVVAHLKGRDLDTLLEYPTSENLAIWVWRRLEAHLPLQAVIVREMPHIAAIYHGPKA